jgi:hypothetical protein
MEPTNSPSQTIGRGSRLLTHLFAPVDIGFLVYFRIIFGLCILFWVSKGWITGLAHHHYVQPRFHFSYFGFEWLQPVLGNGIYLLMAGMVLFSIFMVIGYCYRLSSVMVALGFTYLFLLDKTTYQNHYYLICLISWLMTVMPAERACSIDCWQRADIRSSTVPAWTLWLLRFQIGMPYFYGGIAKISGDWLAGEPMRSALAQKTWYPVVGPLFATEWGVQTWVWGGLLFDLLVVPALLWRKTRFAAYIVSLVFHILNASMWPIGVFPWFMMFATVVFFEPDWPRKIFKLAPLQLAAQQITWPTLSWSRKAVVVILAVYVGIQVSVPFRHHLYQDDVNWTEEAHHFSWHMLLRSKQCGVRFYVTDPQTGHTGSIDLRRYVTPFQANRFGREPRLIHQLARFVADDMRSKGYEEVEVRALAWVSLNGRKPQLMIDPDVDLASQPVQWQTPPWVLPLTEPFRNEAWDVPLLEWEQHLDLPEQFAMKQPAR